MKVILAEHYGICFGVRDAIRKAEQLAAAGPVTILGELVHNPVVRQRLRGMGAGEGSLDDQTTAERQVLITAHGASEIDRQRWRMAGFGVADTTCPLVRHAHSQLALLVKLGYWPVVIGKHGHAEVRGLTGDFPGAYVVETEADVSGLPDAARYGVISQTTQPTPHVQAMVEAIRAARPEAEVRFIDTVCRPTKDRQSAIAKLITQVPAVVVVGGRTSNNTRQLVETVRRAGLRAWQVEGADELEEEWFAGLETVGLTAGTSTPEESVLEVKERLEGMGPEKN